MNESTRFRVSVGDDPDHEDLTAEIYYDGAYVAMVSQEAGFENAVIEIQPGPNSEGWSFPMLEFIQALEHAKQRLWELRRSWATRSVQATAPVTLADGKRNSAAAELNPHLLLVPKPRDQ